MCASVDISGGRCVSVEFCSFDLPLILLKYLLSFENLISFLLFVRMCADIVYIRFEMFFLPSPQSHYLLGIQFGDGVAEQKV